MDPQGERFFILLAATPPHKSESGVCSKRNAQTHANVLVNSSCLLLEGKANLLSTYLKYILQLLLG